MASNIDPLIPPFGNATTAGVRANFASAKTEIEDLQLARVLRLTSEDIALEIFQQCAVNNTKQKITFNGVSFINPNSAATFEFDIPNNEIVFNEAGWYDVSMNMHIVRKVGGSGLADWNVFSETKLPAGAFVAFPESRRVITFPADSVNYKRFIGFSVIAPVTEAGTRLRLMQECNDVTKQVGIIAYPAVGDMPSAAGITLSISRIGGL